MVNQPRLTYMDSLPIEGFTCLINLRGLSETYTATRVAEVETGKKGLDPDRQELHWLLRKNAWLRHLIGDEASRSACDSTEVPCA